MQKAMDAVGYAKLRDEQKAQAGGLQARRDARADGHRRLLLHRDRRRRPVEELRHPRHRACSISAEIRIHPTGSRDRPHGHQVARARGTRRPMRRSSRARLGIPADDITIEEGDTDTAPYGLGTYGSRSTPVAGAATAMAARKIRAKAQMIAAHLLEVHDDDLEWDIDRFRVKGTPERFKTMKEIAWAAYNQVPPGHGAGPRGGELLRSAEHDLSVRRLYLRGRHRRRHRRHQDAALLCARRLRHAHQSDDHRGPGAWRTDRSLRHRHGPGDRL